eukprot:10178256-Alexandrium_andersonii.AAC.1
MIESATKTTDQDHYQDKDHRQQQPQRATTVTATASKHTPEHARAHAGSRSTRVHFSTLKRG